MPDTAPSDTFAPTGEPDHRDRDTWLAAFLAITLGDLDAADMLWREHVGTAYAGILDGSGGWSFDPQRQMYVTRHGRELDGSDLKRVALVFSGGVDNDMRRAASDMSVGLLTIGEWQRKQAQLVKDQYLANAALAAGGFGRLTDELKQAAVGKPTEPPGLAFSLDRLYEFAQGIGTERNDSEDAVVNRASLYASAASGVYENVRRESHKRAVDESGRLQYLYERNVYGDTADHCTSDKFSTGCFEATEAGWQPIGSLPLPGLRSCKMNCGCSMQYSLTGGAFENN